MPQEPETRAPPPWSPSQGAWSVEESVADGAPAAAEPDRATAAEHRYALGGLVGRGAMGLVRAAHDRGLGREVALKELDPARRGDAIAVAAMAREAAITARLDHPGVVAVHDSGVLPDGRPFYTMRLVRGRSLALAIAEAPDAEARRALIRNLLAAAEAVAAAHSAGMVHRDLKPDNILIGAHGETQVVDWGMAAPVAAAAAAWASLPGAERPGAAVGTPAYVAPEQARGAAPAFTHDVWSLGATLYELLAGCPPLVGVTSLAMARQAKPTPLHRATPDAPAELAAIVARAMADDPEQRYPDARAFADDLLAWFEGRRVSAFSYSSTDLLRRLARAWRTPLWVAAAGGLAVVVAVANGWWGTSRALDRAVRAETDATAARRQAELALAKNQVEQAVLAVEQDARARAELLASEALLQAEDPLARGVLAAFGRAARPRLLCAQAGPDCEWARLSGDGAWLLCGGEGRLSRWEGAQRRWSVALDTAGGLISSDGPVRVWDNVGRIHQVDARTGALTAEPPVQLNDWMSIVGPRPAMVGGAFFLPGPSHATGCPSSLRLVVPAPDASRVAAICADGTLLVGPPEDPTRARFATGIEDDHTAAGLVWTPDGDVIIGTLRGGLRLVDTQTGRVLRTIDTRLGTIARLAVSPDGALVAVGGTLNGIGLWNLATGAWHGEIPARSTNTFAFEPDGTLRIYDGASSRWRIDDRSSYRFVATAGLADLALSPDGAHLALAAGDGVVSVLRLADGALVNSADLGEGVVKAVAFSPDGREILASAVTEPRVWRLPVGEGQTARPTAGARHLRRLAWTADGRILGVDLVSGLSRWLSVDGEEQRLDVMSSYNDLERVDAATMVLVGTDGRIGRWPAGAAGPDWVATIDGARAAAGTTDRIVVITDSTLHLLDATGQALLQIGVPDSRLQDVAMSQDGDWIAASRLDGRILVWNGDGAPRAELPGHTERVVAVEFTPDGQQLVSASWDRTARLWDMRLLDRPAAALRAEIVAAWAPDVE